MAYATLDEMAARRPGGIDAMDSARAEALLEDFSDLAEDVAGIVWASVPESPPKAVKRTIIYAALRVFDNPNDLSMEQIGGGYMYQRPTVRVTGVEFTTAERNQILGAVGKSTCYSIRTPLDAGQDSLETAVAIDPSE